jgi:uncharacterized protein (DUF427 family)
MTETAAWTVRTEPSPKWIRGYLAGELAVDSRNALLVWEGPHYPVYYFPAGDVRAELVGVGERDTVEGLGEAELLTVKVATATAERAARRYPDSPVRELREAVRFDWGAMTEWLEEDEPVYTHARDPHKRLDILASSRTIRVELDGVTVAESHRPRILFETGLPPRYYLPLTDVRMDLLRPSATQTHCPYKGAASYWSVETPTRVHHDVVWIYRAPLPENQKIAGLAAFYDEKVDVFLDGEKQRRPRSPFT